ncbi:Na-K-Cl cotransporter [Lyngbya confervoides]|nr:Na-K-Cl cotransporter [Lyngbya confervoides]
MKAFLRRLTASPAEKTAPSEPGLGTFGGVYTPSILTILGVIMYLRFGWVLGHAGLVNTLLIVTLCTAITFLTALSIAEIATDQVVRAGGAYYMISRSLGMEIGGAVGIPLYFAQAFSVALYTLGFAESLTQVFPQLNLTLTALVTTVLVATIAITSANIAIKTQYLIMAAIVFSLVSLILGQPLPDVEINPWSAPVASDETFWSILAIFFPAVTGIMAGVNMSGDLREPARSIPKGTLAAVGTGYVIYMIIPVVLSYRADFASLVQDELIMRRISRVGDAILLGVWGATLSSAIGSILGAPRVLQALTRDGIFPHWLSWLGKGHGEADEPRLGTLFTLGIALAVVCVGQLNLVAPVLSMFFLTTYLVLNTVAAIERFLQSPSFRPTFRVHWIWSLLGAGGCLSVMFLINPTATIAAAIIVLGIYLWLERQELESTWGDARRGFWLMLIRTALYKLSDTPDAKNWRPHLLVFSGAPTRRWPLVQMASDLTHNRGLVTLASIVPEGSRDRSQQSNLEKTLREVLKKAGVQAFVRITSGSTPFEGAKQLVDGYGLGPLTPNTILVGQTGSLKNCQGFCEMVSYCHAARRNVVVLRAADQGVPQPFLPRIDVWWSGMKDNGALMLILADQLLLSERWRQAQVYVKLVVPDEASVAAAHTNLSQAIRQLRIEAKPDVIVARNRAFSEILQTASRNASLVILGMAAPGADPYSDYYTQLQARTQHLPQTMFVLAAQDLSFIDVLRQT